MLQERLKELRKDKKLNKSQLARMVEVSDVTVGYWESGAIKAITSENLIKLAGALEITVSELVDDPLLASYRTEVASNAVAAAAKNQLNQGAASTESAIPDASAAAIAYALEAEDGLGFLSAWNAGEFNTIRKEWPDAPETVFFEGQSAA